MGVLLVGWFGRVIWFLFFFVSVLCCLWFRYVVLWYVVEGARLFLVFLCLFGLGLFVSLSVLFSFVYVFVVVGVFCVFYVFFALFWVFCSSGLVFWVGFFQWGCEYWFLVGCLLWFSLGL